MIGLVLFCAASFAQNPDKAEEYYENGNYAEAIKLYLSLLQKDSMHVEYNHMLGLSYLHSNIDKDKAIKYMQRASKGDNRDPEIIYDLGLAYIYVLKYAIAEKRFHEYRAVCDDKNYKKVDRMLAICEVAQELMKNPIDLELVDLGPNVNSPEPDYYPFITNDGKTLVFTSRREENYGAKREFDGFYSSDIWISKSVDGIFQKAVNAGKKINTYLDEQCVGYSDDGSELYIYLDHIDEYGDLYVSKRLDNGMYGPREKLGENVNSKKLETSGSLSSDGNTLFFASERNGSRGGRDIFMTRRLPDLTWGLPQNIGPLINTEGNEDFPTLSHDHETLYFTSNGHPGMGGYDLFKAKWDPESNSWEKPVNLGYPINTPGDNRTISFTEEGHFAVVSDYWAGKSQGEYDIYKVVFNDHVKNLATFMLTIENGASTSMAQQNAALDIFDQNDDIIGTFRPSTNSNNFLVVLNPGVYTMAVTADGMDEFVDTFVVTDMDAEKPMVFKTIQINQGNQ